MEITTSYSSGRLTLHLSGELDHHGAKGAMRTIDALLDKYMPRDAVLDLAGLTFMDSSGIALIIRTDRRMRETGGRSAIANPRQQPLRVLDASGIDRRIPVKGEPRV